MEGFYGVRSYAATMANDGFIENTWRGDRGIRPSWSPLGLRKAMMQ